MTFRKTAAVMAVALPLAACEGTGGFGSDGETIGTLGGAAGGALLGSQIGEGTGGTVATIAGAALGALAGRQLGRYLTQDDQQQAQVAERRAVAQGETITWRNPDSGRSGTVAPVETFTNERGQLCRTYTHTVYVDGDPETARGTACRQADGTWTLVS